MIGRICKLFALIWVSLLPLRALAQGIGSGEKIEELTALGQTVDLGGIISGLMLIGLAWVVLRFADNLVEELGKASAERRLLLQRIGAFFRFFVYLVTVVGFFLVAFDFSEQTLAFLGGGIVVAIGFATRDLLASLVAGVMIIFDRPFQVGDRVSFGGKYGDVRQIGLRSVKLRTLDDSIVTIPNSLFLSDVSSSGNFGVLDMQIDVDFHIGIDQDASRARELVLRAAAISRYVYLPKSVVVQVAQVQLDTCPALRIRLKAYVLDTQYEKSLVTDVTLRVQEAFAEQGILPPALLYRDIGSLQAGRPV
jgi:small-conductance mechanosensitive channel